MRKVIVNIKVAAMDSVVLLGWNRSSAAAPRAWPIYLLFLFFFIFF